MPPRFADYDVEMAQVEQEGWTIIERSVMDYGQTLGVLIERKGRRRVLMLRECFYDTDDEGNRTKWHGVIDIRETPWSRNLRRRNGSHTHRAEP